MSKFIAKKLKMTQIFKGEEVIPVTPLKIEEKEPITITEGELVSVRGRSRGLGFQGVVKRHGFSGGPKTHGQKEKFRASGSIGATTPQRVLKGKKMAGRMGGRMVTVKNLKVVKVDKSNRLIFVKGAVPGYKNSKCEIKRLEVK